jgi:hypothetical protein
MQHVHCMMVDVDVNVPELGLTRAAAAAPAAQAAYQVVCVHAAVLHLLQTL